MSSQNIDWAGSSVDQSPLHTHGPGQLESGNLTSPGPGCGLWNPFHFMKIKKNPQRWADKVVGDSVWPQPRPARVPHPRARAAQQQLQGYRRTLQSCSGEKRSCCVGFCQYFTCQANHGGPTDDERHAGDLGNIRAFNPKITRIEKVNPLILMLWFIFAHCDHIIRCLILVTILDDSPKDGQSDHLGWWRKPWRGRQSYCHPCRRGEFSFSAWKGKPLVKEMCVQPE